MAEHIVEEKKILALREKNKINSNSRVVIFLTKKPIAPSPPCKLNGRFVSEYIHVNLHFTRRIGDRLVRVVR
jgi:hypothetical protein